MEITYRDYNESDFADYKKCMEKLQDYLAGADPLKRLRRLTEYGEAYTNKSVQTVKQSNGKIILSYSGKKIVGCVTGVLIDSPADETHWRIPQKTGEILELFVDEKYRVQGIGKELMSRIESYLKQKGCDTIVLSVFAPNIKARMFYQKLGYIDRTIIIRKDI